MLGQKNGGAKKWWGKKIAGQKDSRAKNGGKVDRRIGISGRLAIISGPDFF
jgi:hypothetical protein